MSEPLETYVAEIHQVRLADAVLTLRKHTTLAEIVLRFKASQEFKAAGLAGNSVSHQLLGRLTDGKPLPKKQAVLTVLYAFLRNDKTYGISLRNAENPTPVPHDFAGEFAKFLLGAHVATVFNLEKMREAFPASYVVVRQDWEADRYKDGFVRVSQLDIEKTESGISVVETQDFQQEQPPYYQRDVGALGSCGKYAFLFTRQEKGDCVKLWVIQTSYPGVEMPTEWFQGELFGASHMGVFVKVKFFCRRLGSGNMPPFGIRNLSELKDVDAIKHFAQR